MPRTHGGKGGKRRGVTGTPFKGEKGQTTDDRPSSKGKRKEGRKRGETRINQEMNLRKPFKENAFWGGEGCVTN